MFKARKIKREIQKQTQGFLKKSEEKWIYYNKIMHFKDEVTLDKIIKGFLMPLHGFYYDNYPMLKGAPDSLFFMTAFTAIAKLKTHPMSEVNAAVEELSKKFAR